MAAGRLFFKERHAWCDALLSYFLLYLSDEGQPTGWMGGRT